MTARATNEPDHCSPMVDDCLKLLLAYRESKSSAAELLPIDLERLLAQLIVRLSWWSLNWSSSLSQNKLLELHQDARAILGP